MTTATNHLAQDWNSVVADNLRAEAARQRWSGRKIAAQLGLPPQWVNRRLSGSTIVTPDDLMLFAAFFGVPVATFFETQKAPPTTTGEGRAVDPAGFEPTTSTVISGRFGRSPAVERQTLAPVTALRA